MNYLDPYQLLELDVDGPQGVRPDLLQMAQTRLAEKIAQSPGDDIDVHGRKIQKAEVQRLSEAMNDVQVRSYFWEMRSISGLLAFLENDHPAAAQGFQLTDQNLDPGLVTFASTYVAHKIDALLGKALQTGKWADALLLLRNLYRIDRAADSLALVQAEAFFEGLRLEMETILSASEGRPVVMDSRKYYQGTLLGVLNTLPDRCQPLRDQFAITLSRWAVTLAKWQKDSQTAYLISVAACKVITSTHVSTNLKTVQLKLKDDTGITADDEQAMSGAKIASGIGTGLVVIVIILRIALLVMRH
jgi:hypothetical protein